MSIIPFPVDPIAQARRVIDWLAATGSVARKCDVQFPVTREGCVCLRRVEEAARELSDAIAALRAVDDRRLVQEIIA
jgi:hypothetical protein